MCGGAVRLMVEESFSIHKEPTPAYALVHPSGEVSFFFFFFFRHCVPDGSKKFSFRTVDDRVSRIEGWMETEH